MRIWGFLTFFIIFGAYAQSDDSQTDTPSIKPYTSTENAGLNRIERIEYIETYLKGLAQSLAKMDQKIEANGKLLEALDSRLSETQKALKASELKEEANTQSKASGVESGNDEEIRLLKADILKLKNSDIKNLNTEVQGLSGVIRNIEIILKGQLDK